MRRSPSITSRLIFLLLTFFWIGATNHCLIEGCFAKFSSTVLGQENTNDLSKHHGATHQHKDHRDSQSHQQYQPYPLLILPGSQVGVDFINAIKSQILIFLPLLFLPILIIFGLSEKNSSVFEVGRCPSRFFFNQIAALILAPNAPPLVS